MRIPTCLNLSPSSHHRNPSNIRFLSYFYQSYGSLTHELPFLCNFLLHNCFPHSITTNFQAISFKTIHFLKSLTQKCLSWRDTMTRSEANIVILTLGLTFSFKFTNFCMVILIYIWIYLFYSLSITSLYRFFVMHIFVCIYFMHLSNPIPIS